MKNTRRHVRLFAAIYGIGHLHDRPLVAFALLCTAATTGLYLTAFTFRRLGLTYYRFERNGVRPARRRPRQAASSTRSPARQNREPERTSDYAGVEDRRLGRTGTIKHKAAVPVVDADDAIGFSLRLPVENGFECLHGGHGLTVGGQVVVLQLANLFQSTVSPLCRPRRYSTYANSRTKRSMTSIPYPRWLRSPHGSRNEPL